MSNQQSLNILEFSLLKNCSGTNFYDYNLVILLDIITQKMTMSETFH